VRKRPLSAERQTLERVGTDTGQAEERLGGSEAKYRRIFENIQDVYYEVGLDGTILEISPSIERYFPLRRDEWLGRSITEFYADPAQREDFLRIIQKEGSVHDFEIRLKQPQGALMTCAITATILTGSGGEPPRIVGAMRDISVRKRVEQALKEREEELSIQSRNLAEMNTALKVLLRQREEDRLELQEQIRANVKALILPGIEKLLAGPLSAPQRTRMEQIERHIREITSPFLHRISQAYADLTPQEIRVAEAVKSGRTTKEIADLLCLSGKTVDYHRNNIRRKLGLNRRSLSLRSFLLTLS
jgi:PAS domain S-box-containing protein